VGRIKAEELSLALSLPTYRAALSFKESDFVGRDHAGNNLPSEHHSLRTPAYDESDGEFVSRLI
jgi:hypothetical protein